MNERNAYILDEFSIHLRFVQFTLVVSCITLLAIILSDRQTTIRLANDQINQISEFTSEMKWDEGIIKNAFVSWIKNPKLVNHSIRLDTTKTNYIFCANTSCENKLSCTLNYNEGLFHNLDDKNFLDINFYVKKPTTLTDFEAFYNRISQGCCVYSISNILNGSVIVYYADYTIDHDDTGRFSGMNFNMYPQPSISIENIVIKPADGTVGTSDYECRAQFMTELSLDDYSIIPKYRKLKHPSLVITAIRENNEREYFYTIYAIPLGLEKHRYAGIKIIRHPQWTLHYYKNQFDALATVTERWSETEIPIAKKIVNAEHARTGDPFDIMGIKLPAGLTLTWGGYLIAGLQLYFLFYLRELNRRNALFSGFRSRDLFPWLSLYPNISSVAVYYCSVVLLPITVAVALVYVKFEDIASVGSIGYIANISASLVIIFIAVLLAKEQRRLHGSLQRLHDDGE